MDPSSSPTGHNGGHEISMDFIASLLSMARQRINEGNPSLALQAVVLALRASGGERAVLQALGRARELYHNRRQATNAVDQLSALLAECALATGSGVIPGGAFIPGVSENGSAKASGSEAEEMDVQYCNPDVDPAAHPSAPILAESGRLQVVMDASSDGSSFVCMRCGGVVSNLRKDEHFAFWCSQSSS